MMMQLNGYKGNNMSLGGGSSSQQQLDPALRDLFIENYGSAKTTAGGLDARTFAGFTPEQNTAMGNIANLANPASEGFNALRNSYGVANTAAQYKPQTVGATQFTGATVDPAAQAKAAELARTSIRDVNAAGVTGSQVATEALGSIAPKAAGNIRDVTAGSFLNQNIQDYINPYTKAVTDVSLADLERSRQLQQQRNAAQATAAKSFGGSRQGVAEAETNRAYDENAARLIAERNAASFDAASRLSEADLARYMQAEQLNQAKDIGVTSQALQLAGQFGLANQDAALRAALANQGVDLSTGSLNTQNVQQVNLANQAAQNARSAQQANLLQQAGITNADRSLQASLANQGAGLTANAQSITAANTMANAGTSFADMGLKTNLALADQGLLRQGLTQQQIDAIRNLPLEQQQIINQALGINPGGGSGQTSTSTSRQGLLGLLGLG
jgi:hypothetical protein